MARDNMLLELGARMFNRCPGAGPFAEPVPEVFRCPHCGQDVEIFTNETYLKCYHCGCIVTKNKSPSCFDWCKYADKCREEIEAQRASR